MFIRTLVVIKAYKTILQNSIRNSLNNLYVAIACSLLSVSKISFNFGPRKLV
jgi:hypothetical protein